MQAKSNNNTHHQYPCTECKGDAYIGYTGGNGGWGGKVGRDERLCAACFQKRGGDNFFGRVQAVNSGR